MISRLRKLEEIKRSRNVDAFLITSPSSLKYFSGYFFYFEYGASPFHLLPAIIMIVPGSDACLLLADNEMGQDSFIDPLLTVIPYESYTFEKAPDPSGACLQQLMACIEKNKLVASRIGIESKYMPYEIVQTLQKSFSSIEWVNVSDDIAALKIVKDTDEIENIRNAAALADIGQRAVLKNVRSGMTELELFSLVHAEMEAQVGCRVPLMADLSSGTNTSTGGGMPTGSVIEAGNIVLSDFQPCLQGYWGDSCNTMVVGIPTADQKKIYRKVKEGLEIGIEAIRPGVRACEIDRLMRNYLGSYPHHSGHSVGTSYHESPRITPYNTMELSPGMVIALEPAIYAPAFGVRLEHLMLVTETGCEILTHFNHCFEQ